ncbi:TPA: RNA-dependent DNA polymerase [Pseudomonas aeruginosa]|nr:RNA-dependent DNA polymerase [Pseudomonas aeruginosa]HEN8225858.1 RNA-dependent DNA polymerase [Pseudomonas aeruginosa]HEO1554817.1 RNA-dependent DNA polymerase [Pseudomonas aeruginosa]
MSLEKQLVKYIKAEANKLASRHHAYHNALHLEHLRKTNRLGVTTNKILKIPEYWNENSKFNPFHVIKNKNQIAHAIAKKILDGTYQPNKPAHMEIPKPSGGHRNVTVYQIPDAAVSTLFYQQLLKKNKHRLSSFAYAYRDDRNAHFAIQDIALELSQSPRIFVAEFDFSKFFDNIQHDYLYAQFDKNGFSISESEKKVIKAFLGDTGKGVPQGTSISLFLANLVCWQLDKQLEISGLRFARYADDTVIWSNDYQKINTAYEIVHRFSKDTGVSINIDKSEGISLLCPDGTKSEFVKSTSSIDFLGYRLSPEKISIKEKSVAKIKREISYILYKHLIQPLKRPRLQSITIPANNRDVHLLSAISEIRRFLYGDLTDEMISNYINGASNKIFFKGTMSFYPLINDESQLKNLDRWLVMTVYKSIKLRQKLLATHGHHCGHSFPFNIPKKEIASGLRSQKIGGKRRFQLPSFYFIYQALKKGLADLGVGGVMNPKSNQYNYYV